MTSNGGVKNQQTPFSFSLLCLCRDYSLKDKGFDQVIVNLKPETEFYMLNQNRVRLSLCNDSPPMMLFYSPNTDLMC